MDINTALAAMRELVKDAIEDDGSAGVMALQFDAIDEWLSRGGFLPTPWERKP